MKKFWILILALAAFLLGDTLATDRCNRYYQPKMKKLVDRVNLQKKRIEILKVQRRAWVRAAKEIDRGVPTEVVQHNIDEAINYARILEQSL